MGGREEELTHRTLGGLTSQVKFIEGIILVDVDGVSGRDRADSLAWDLSPTDREAAIIRVRGDIDRIGRCQVLLGRCVVVG
ncbi:MAG: hypothetical protein Tsb0020_13940 [Haliangiales bacterium]